MSWNHPSPAADETAWIARARPLGTILCEAAFRIVEDVYIGPADGFTPREWAEARVPLPPPALPCRLPGRVITADLLDHEDALIAHYRRIVAIATRHGKHAALRQPFPWFAVTPVIIGHGEVRAGFPWNDDLDSATAILRALASAGQAPDGTVWDDEDQGWAIRITAMAGTIRGVEWDAEGPPPADAGWAVEAGLLARQAAAALARLDVIQGRLAHALGRDCWTRRP
ncbi:MAG TPA: hypothetical protein VGM87_24955 [Roseomonas sp.]|jgi:hypothetical protein